LNIAKCDAMPLPFTTTYYKTKLISTKPVGDNNKNTMQHHNNTSNLGQMDRNVECSSVRVTVCTESENNNNDDDDSVVATVVVKILASEKVIQ